MMMFDFYSIANETTDEKTKERLKRWALDHVRECRIMCSLTPDVPDYLGEAHRRKAREALGKSVVDNWVFSEEKTGPFGAKENHYTVFVLTDTRRKG